MRRIDVPPHVALETIEAHPEGLVCLSGCADHGVRDEPTLRRLLAAFGRENLRLELQRPFRRDDRARNRVLAELAARQLLARARLAGGDGGALPRASGRGGRDRRAGRAPELRSALRPRLPLPR